MAKLTPEDLKAFEQWRASQEGAIPTNPALLKRWEQNLHQEASAYARGERPLDTAMEKEGAETRGSWLKTSGVKKERSPEQVELMKRIIKTARGLFIKLLECDFFSGKDTIRQIEDKIERELINLEDKYKQMGSLSSEDKTLEEMLVCLQSLLPVLLSEKIIDREDALFDVPADLNEKILTI